MSILKMLGFGGADAAKPIEAVGGVLDSLFTSDEEKLDKQAVIERLRQKPDELQAAINSIEAQHRSVFVAGWRPATGWVCVLALLYNYVVRDLIAWGISIMDSSIPMPPALQMEHLLTILLGMLGLGAMRTVEKMNKISK